MSEQPRGTVWEGLRQQHGEVVGERDPLYIDDPIHDGVVLKYVYKPLEDSEKSLKRARKVKGELRQVVALSIGRIIDCLDEILVVARDGEIPEGKGGRKLYPQPLKPLADEGDAPMRFDERLAESMGFPAEKSRTATNIVRQWFGNNGYLIGDHAGEISEWLAEVGDEVREEFEETLGKA
jgi:hypothetical protein